VPSKRQQLADRRSRVGESATPVNIPTDHLQRAPVPSGADSAEDVVAFWIPLADLEPSPFQYRYALDEAAVGALAQSIESQELYQPITVRPSGPSGRYQVVLGHRRLEAFRRLGRVAVPAMIREYDDAQVLRAMLDENLRREDVNLFEQTEGVVRLVTVTSGRAGDPVDVTRRLLGEMRSQLKATGQEDFAEPHRTAARLIQEVTGMPWLSFYANRMRVYSLPEALQAAVRAGMPYSLALAVQRLPVARQGAALAFLGGQSGPWRSRQELQAWAGAGESGPAAYTSRLQTLGRQLDRRTLTAADQGRVERLLEQLERLLG
jgi:ParB-like chromosome segregation protein Spo0J